MIVWYVLFRVGIVVLLALLPAGILDLGSQPAGQPAVLDWVVQLVGPDDHGGDSQDEVIDEPITGEDQVTTPPPSGIVGEGVSAGPGPGDTPAPTSTRQPSETTPTARTSPPATPSATATPTSTPPPLRGRRYDEPVLRWLPELRAASRAHQVSVALLAGITRVASGGEPGLIRQDGRRGLLGLTEQQLNDLGLTGNEWLDPARHLEAGAHYLATLRANEGSWRRALAAYAGTECDELGQCPDDAIAAILAWRDYYSRVLRDPEGAGLHALPADWHWPDLRAIEEEGPHLLAFPPGFGTPTPSASPAPDVSPTAPEASPPAFETPEEPQASPQDGAETPTPTPTEEADVPVGGT
ncbi:MAG: hypothetical protein C4346_01635, partial [Chloroflexota bacterium]